MMPIGKGFPTTYQIDNENDGIYFSYRHESSKGFFIHVQEDFGFVETLVSAVTDENNIGLNLPKDQSSAMWSTYQTNDRNFLEIPSTDENFCSKCYYIIKIESTFGSNGTITIQETGKQENVNQMTVIKMGVPVSATLQSTELIHYKFLMPDDKPYKVDVNTLAGEVDFEITSDKPNDDEFGKLQNVRNTTLVYKGDSSNGVFIFNKSGQKKYTHSLYYLTIKPREFYCNVVITVGHIGKYTRISETTPQSVIINNDTSLFYYNVEPTIGKMKISIEAFPHNKNEKFAVFIKVVDKEDEISTSEESTQPAWQLTAEEVINSKDKALFFDSSEQYQTFTNIDVNRDDNDKEKVILIAVRKNSKEPLNSKVDLNIASSHVQPLVFDRPYYGLVENKKDTFKIYEVLVPHLSTETYVVELMPCYGKAELYIARNFRQILDKKYISMTSQLVNGRLTAVLENNHRRARKYIIAVKGATDPTASEEDQFAYTEFTVEARKYPSEIAKNSYHAKYFIPKDAEIDYEVTDGGDIKISWPKIFNIEGSSELQDGVVTYDIFIRKEDVLGLESPCSMQSHFKPINKEPIKGNEYIISMESQELDEANNVYINVLAHIGTGDEIAFGEYPMTYHPLKIHMENIEEEEEFGFSSIVIIVVILILVLGIVIIVCLYRMYKRAAYKLKTNVREVNQAEFGQEMKEAKVYNRFSYAEESNA